MLGLFLGLAAALTTFAADLGTVLVVVGAQGEREYGTNFQRQAELWSAASVQGGCRPMVIGLADAGATNDLATLRTILEAESGAGTTPLWLVLIGHGTFDGKTARFNLRGPDLADADLAHWLAPVQRPLVVINTASSSGPFLKTLAGTNRVVITSTRSGNEQNFARFGQFLAQAISQPASDLDKDGSISLLEAFLAAAQQVREFYKVEQRLATEHALIDDNGDGLGTPADWFRGLRARRKAKGDAPLDGTMASQMRLVHGEGERRLTAEQRAQLQTLEAAVVRHREKRAFMPEAEYYSELERLLLPLARFYASPGVPPGHAPPP